MTIQLTEVEDAFRTTKLIWESNHLPSKERSDPGTHPGLPSLSGIMENPAAMDEGIGAWGGSTEKAIGSDEKDQISRFHSFCAGQNSQAKGSWQPPHGSSESYFRG